MAKPSLNNSQNQHPFRNGILAPDQIFEKVKDSVVVVRVLNKQGKIKGQGSGVVLPSGKIATNFHVTTNGSSYQVGQDGKFTKGIIFAGDKDKDICILDVQERIGNPVELGSASDLKVGKTVYAVGAPQGLELSLSNGIVSQLRGSSPPVIQTTAAISQGSSGGGLFDEEGRLVGLTTLYMKDGQNLNFAMPVEWIEEINADQKKIVDGHNPTEWLRQALVLEERKEWKTLHKWARKWTESEPKNAVSWYSLGYACFRSKTDHNVAVDAFRQTLKIKPDDARVWSLLGVSYVRLERFTDAIDVYRQGLKIDPASPETLRMLGATYFLLKQYNEAVDACSQAVHIDPEDVETWFILGCSYFLSGNRNAALEAVEKLRKLHSDKADKLYSLIGRR